MYLNLLASTVELVNYETSTFILRLCLAMVMFSEISERISYSHISVAAQNRKSGEHVMNTIILRKKKTIEGYLDSVPSLTSNTIKYLLIKHSFHSSAIKMDVLF